MKVQKALLLVFITAVMSCLVGCPSRTSIADINKDPGRFSGKEVTIGGHASSAFGAMGKGIYQVDDGTGRMWVFSPSFGVPSNGAKIAVTGTIQQGFSFGGQSYAVILRQTKSR